MDHDAVTQRVEQLRQTAGLTQAAMADIAGIHQPNYSRMFQDAPTREGRSWTAEHLERIARGLGQSLDWLIMGKGSMRTRPLRMAVKAGKLVRPDTSHGSPRHS